MTTPAPDYRALFDSLPGPFLVLAPDLSIVAVSDAYLRVTRLQREKIMGRPLFEVFPDNPADPEADGVRNLRASLERVLEERRMDAMKEHTYAIRRPEPQGGGFEARRWRPVNSPILDADGKLTWIIHQLEDALRDSESRYRFLFENMLSGYALCRMSGKGESPRDFMFLHVNAKFSELTGLKSVEGKMAGEVMPGIRESSPEMFASFARVAGTGTPERIEIYIESLKNWFDIAVYRPGPGQFIAVFDNITKRKLADAARSQLAAIVDSSEDAIIGMSLDGIITSWNRGAEKLFGYTAGEAAGQSIRMLIPMDRPAEQDEILARIMLGESVVFNETVLTRRGGDPVDVAVSISPTRNSGGEVIGASKIARDITQRKRAQAVLHDSEERHRTMFQNNPLPMWVYDPVTLRFLAVNQTAVSHYGYSESEFLQMSLKDIRPPEDVARFEETMRGLGVDKVSSKIWRHRKKNGEIITVDISADMIQFAGRPAGLVLANNITERQQVGEKAAQLQAEVTQSAQEWRITLDALDTPVLLFGMDGTILRMNRAACDLTGRDCLAGIDQSLPREDDPFPWPQMIDLTRRAAQGKCQTTVQLTDPGSARIWDCVARYFDNPDTGTGSVVFSAREITNLVRLQESLRRGEMMSSLGSLVAGVAHEVRNPLFGILATLDAFEANFGARLEYQEYFSLLRGETDRLSALMKDLLEYGRPPELQPVRGSVEALLETAVNSVRPLALKSGARLELVCPADLTGLKFDRNRLLQVFINLLDNAVRHSPPGGTVRLSAVRSADSRWLECQVIDQGPGLKAEELSRLFQPFFSRRAEGTGLGLAIAQRIVEQHGGQILADNRPEGGAVFTVRLPLADPSH